MIARLRGLVAVLVIFGLVLGGPWLLVRYGDWPITSIPGLVDVRQSFDTVVSDQMVFGVLTLAAWVVWALFMVSLLIEAVAAIRCRDAHQITLAAPMQRGARVLVAMIVLAFAVHQNAASVAGAARGPTPLPPPQSAAIAEFRSLPETAAGGPGSSHSADARPMSDGPSNLAVAAITVEHGDSAWSIADARLGDGMRWRELWDLNRARPQPDGRAWIDPQLIRPGWVLVLPAEAQGLPDPGASPAREPAPAVHVVERGDTLSGIAERYLGAPTRFVELFDLNRGSPQPDGRKLDDPALILPGWSIWIPPTPSALTAPSAGPTAPVDDPTNGEITVRGDEGSPSTTNEYPATEPDTPAPNSATADAPAPSAVSPPTSPNAPTTPARPAPSQASTPPTTLDPTYEVSEVSETWPSTATLLAGVSSAIALASALLLRLRRGRRRSMSRGAEFRPRLAEGTLTTEAAVAAAADLPLVRWAGQSLAELFAGLRPPHLQSIPQAVELSDSTGLEILWSAPNMAAPAPWAIADSGWTWRLPYDPDATVPVEALPAALPSLVTIGRRDGRQLLVNLEAFGSVAVRGDVERVTAFLCSLAAELALGDDLADAYVNAVNVDLPMSSERLWIGDIDEAIQRVESFSASVREAVRPTGAESSHAFRSGPNGAHLEVAVVIASMIDDAKATRLLHSVGANQGAAAVVASNAPANASVRIDADGSAVLDPLGVSFVAVGLPADSTRQIAALMDRIDNPPEEFSTLPLPLDLGELPAPNGSMTALPASSNGHVPSMNSIDPDDPEHLADRGRSPLDAAMVVKVLGIPRVPDRPKLKRRELILTVFLACRGGQVNVSAVQDALWNGQAVQGKTVWNLVGRTRTALGQLPDGTWALPPSDRNRRMKGLADGVTTDLAILRHLFDEAQQVPSSQALELLWQGLELVEGPPFDADGYDWAHHGTQDVAEASSLIERSAAQLVELALNVDDVERARGAITQGLRGLPGDEVLYRLRMRVEHHAGNLAGVSTAYDELVRYLADLDAEPSSATVDLLRSLLRPAPGVR